MQIQGALTLFAANFVAGPAAWVRARRMEGQRQVGRLFARVQALVRGAANSPALVAAQEGHVLVRGSPTSRRAGVVLRLREAAVQLARPLFSSTGGCSG